MKVLVCGSRLWTNRAPIERELRKRVPLPQWLAAEFVLVHGAHWEGADALADLVGRDLGVQIRRYPADWKKFGRAGGPKRNQQMLDMEHPPAEPIDLCLAFAENFAGAHGTSDMRRRAITAGIRVESFES